MAQWKIAISSRKCGYYDGYGGCLHRKVIERTEEFHPPCRKKYCPLKIREFKFSTPEAERDYKKFKKAMEEKK